MPILTRIATGLRLFVICLVVVSVSLPMAWISLGKLLLFTFSLVYLVIFLMRGSTDLAARDLWSVRVILLIWAVFALSLMWSEAPQDLALQAFVKHGKLLEIVILVMLIRNAREAGFALKAFIASQAFFILSSWIMATGFRVPWATSVLHPQYHSVVYSTYLDQTLIFSAAAAVIWHMRKHWQASGWLALLLAVAAISNNLFLQEGKTGYLATFTVLTLVVMWEIPNKWRLAVLILTPTLIGVTMYAGSVRFHDRMAQVISESQSYTQDGNNASSSGFRLHAWRRSVQAMQEQPLIGSGVGSWKQSVARIEGADADKVFGSAPSSNPHQEFLLWGVELGVGGTLLLILLMVSLVRDALRFEGPVCRATLSVIAVMAVACMFNSSLYDALIGDFFCVTLGLLLALGIRRERTDAPFGPSANHKVIA